MNEYDLRGNGAIEWERKTITTTVTSNSTEINEELLYAHELPQLSKIRRRQDEVEILGSGDCRLSTQLSTTYPGSQGNTGIIFTVKALKRIEILNFEFDFYENAPDLNVDIYFREGGFDDTNFNIKSEWTAMASTTAVPAPNLVGAIVPVQNVKSVILEPDQVYAFYLTFKTRTVLKLSPSSRERGEVWRNDDKLEIHTGVDINGVAFANDGSISGAADFRGIVHYTTVQACDQSLTTTKVQLEYAVDSDPLVEVIEELNGSVEGAVRALMVLNVDLIRYNNFHFLDLLDISSGFAGKDRKLIIFVIVIVNSGVLRVRFLISKPVL